MIECPDCHGILKPHAKRCACGWVEKTSTGRVASLVDPHRWDCEHIDRGQRCTQVGRFSQSTLGGGPIYCLDHFPPFRAMRAGVGKHVGPTLAFKAVVQSFKRFADVPLDDDADVERAAIQEEHRHART